MLDDKYSTILDKLLELYKNYATEYRATTEPYQLEERLRQDPNYTYHPADKTIRESLIEHVGSLPIVALVTKHKHPHMLWNPFLTEFHLEIIERLKQKYWK